MADNQPVNRKFQFSLKSLLIYSVVAAFAFSLILKMATWSLLAIGLFALWLIVTAPFMFFAEIVDWLLGVNSGKK
jgi:hypothetical protein